MSTKKIVHGKKKMRILCTKDGCGWGLGDREGREGRGGVGGWVGGGRTASLVRDFFRVSSHLRESGDTHTYTHTHTHTHTYILIHTHTHTHTHTYILIHTHTHTHVPYASI